MKRYTVIVAGGSGKRMESAVPKQFMLLADRPVLARTIEAFAGTELIVVLPEDQISYWKGLCRAYAVTTPHKIVVGGASRSESVQNGLRAVPDDALVAIHDGVRPLVSAELIERTFVGAEQTGSGVPAIECVDSIRHDGKAADRSEYMLVQTPQTFRASEIKAAYQKVDNTQQTDDATVYEMAGHMVTLVKGERRNIKITLPVDLKIAEALL